MTRESTEPASATRLPMLRLDVFQRLETRALVRAPVIRGGRLRAFMYAHDAGVREWTEPEADLLQDVAARTWTEIERAREKLLAAIETTRLQQFFGADDAERVEEFRPDAILPALAAIQR